MGENQKLETERRLIYFLPALILVMVLAAVLVRSQSGSQQEINALLFERLTSDYLVRLNMLRTQWSIHGRPSTMAFAEELMPMSELGLPDLRTASGQFDCQRLWEQLLQRPLLLNREPVSAIAMVDRPRQIEYCRYWVRHDLYVDIDVRHGILSKRLDSLEMQN